MAQQEQRTVLIDIQSNYEQVLTNLVRVNNQVEQLQNEAKQLRQEYRDGEISQSEYSRALAETNIALAEQRAESRQLQGDLRNMRQLEQEQTGSLRDLRAEVNALTRQYDGLSRAERESAEGQGLLTRITDLREEINTATEATGRFQQNVGNYQNAIQSALTGNNQYIAGLLQMAQAQGTAMAATDGLTDGLAQAGPAASIARTGMQAITGAVRTLTAALIANPIIAVIAAIIVVFTALRNALNSSEQATARFNAILAPLRLLLDGVLSVLQTVVGWLLDGVEAFLDLAMATSRLLENLPLVGQYFKQANDQIERSVQLSQEQYELERRNREFLVQSAKDQRDIAQLRADSQDTENFTAQQRLEMLQRVNQIERQNLDTALELKRQELALAEEEASRTENNMETERRLAELRAAVYNAERDHYNRVRELIGQERTLRNEVANEEKKRQEESNKRSQDAIKLAQERNVAELTARRALEDAQLELITDAAERTETELRLSGNRRIEDLRRQLTESKKLSQQAVLDINATILAAEQDLENQLRSFRKQTQKEVLDREARRIETDLNNRLAVLRAESQEALNIRLQLLENRRNAEIQEAEKTGADVALIRARYDKLVSDEQLKNIQANNSIMLQEQQLYWQTQLQQAQLNGESELQVQLAMKQRELSEIARIEGESEQAYLLRRQILANEILMLERNVMEEIVDFEAQQLEALAGVFGAASQLLTEFGEQNEALAAFSKALALFEIGVNTAKAIAQGVASAQSVPFPGNLIAIATTVATVLANIAQATQLVNKAKQPKANFAVGGTISGPGSGTSDSIPVNVSNGESVITARATSLFTPMLSAFNQLGGGVPITTQNAAAQVEGEDMLARAFASALKSMPAPIVSVEEISRVQGRVEVLDTEIGV